MLRALVAIICLAGAVWLVMEYFNPAPPSTITIATGAKGGAYEFFAQQYREKLARANVTLNIRITDGTSENIRLLEDPTSGVQVAFVVGGASNSQKAPGLLSLGRVDYQVFWLFYRGTETLDHLGVPVRHSDLFFELKTHIDLVRQRLTSRRATLHSEKREVS